MNQIILGDSCEIPPILPDKSDPNKIAPSRPFSLLPGLIERTPFKLDIRELLLTTMSHDGSWERTKPALRFFEVWNTHVTTQERNEIITRLNGILNDGFHAKNLSIQRT